MPYLLNVVYLLVLLVCWPVLAWRALRQGKYREGLAEKFLGNVPRREGDAPCVWLHGVSVGEVNLLGTVIDELKRRRPGLQFAISTTTKTGYALALKKYGEHLVFHCPLDFTWATRRAVAQIRPDWLVLAELELWPNLVGAAKRRGARVAVINGRLSEHSFRGYRRIRPLVAGLLRRLDLVGVQDEAYARRFRALGVPEERLHVTGSIKYDGAQRDRGNPATEALRKLAGLADDDVVLLAGSTQEPEEAVVLETWQRLKDRHPRLRLIVVPRHPERFDRVADLLEASGERWQRRSDLEHGPADPAARVLLVDAVGELGAWWGTAQIAFVGGSLGNRGGQNMIEPAAYGAAVSFGPNTRNFRDVVATMLGHDAAVVVRDGEELYRFVERVLEEPDFALGLGGRAADLVARQQGAVRRTVDLMLAAEAPGRAATRSGRDDASPAAA